LLELNKEIIDAEQNKIDTTKIEETYEYQNLNNILSNILKNIEKIEDYSNFLSNFNITNDNKLQLLKKTNALNLDINSNKSIIEDLASTSLTMINNLKNQIMDFIKEMKQKLENLEKVTIIPDLYNSINEIFLKEIESDNENFDNYCNLKLEEFDIDSNIFSNQKDEIIKLNHFLKNTGENTTTENLKDIYELEDESILFISRLINEEEKIIPIKSINLKTLRDVEKKLPKLYESLNITLVGN